VWKRLLALPLCKHSIWKVEKDLGKLEDISGDESEAIQVAGLVSITLCGRDMVEEPRKHKI
jgi:hypothetical protein